MFRPALRSLVALVGLVYAAAGVAQHGSCASSWAGTTVCGAPTARAGDGLDDFVMRLVRLKPDSVVNILVIGNSVARWNNGLTGRVFRSRLQSCFPSLRFVLSTSGTVEGGFGASHLLYCGREAWQTADIILVHVAELASRHDGRKLISQLRSASPAGPLVLMIKHCSMPQLEMLADGSEAGAAVPTSLQALNGSAWFNLLKSHVTMRQSRAGVRKALAYAKYQAQCEAADEAVARELNVSVVDSCALLRSRLVDGATRGCGPASDAPSHAQEAVLPQQALRSPPKADLERVAMRYFPFNPKQHLADPLHPGTKYSEMQGGAAAALITARAAAHAQAAQAAPTSPRATPPLPMELSTRPEGERLARAPNTTEIFSAALGSSRGSLVPSSAPRLPRGGGGVAPWLPYPWCLKMGDDLLSKALLTSEGWALRTGGAGGQKRWLQAESLGARLLLELPVTSARLVLEYYKHDTLPLGAVLVETWWNARGEPPSRRDAVGATNVTLDGRCATDHEWTSHCPPGQGFYHRAVLADFGEGAASLGMSATVRLTVVPRADGAKGSAFSVATLVSEL